MSVSAELVWRDGPIPEVWSDADRLRVEIGWRALSWLWPPLLGERWWRGVVEKAGWV